MVNSKPCWVGPPSMISGMRPPRLVITCSARVGLIDPLALAEGAARGRPTVGGAPAWWHERVRGSRRSEGRPSQSRRCRHRTERNDKVSGPGQWISASASRFAENLPMLRRRRVRHVDDQRVEARASLGLVDSCHSLGIGRVGREAINRSQSDPRPARQRRSGARLRRLLRRRRQNPRIHETRLEDYNSCVNIRRVRARSVLRRRCQDGSSAPGSPAIRS